MSQIAIDQFEVGLMENFVYFVGDAKTKEVMVVDPAWEVDTIVKRAHDKGFIIKGVLISHYHNDHTNGIEGLLKHYDVPVYMNKKDVPYLDLKSSNLRGIDSAEEIQCGGVKIQAIHTPGHTPGSQCFKIENNLISGDTLFINACGRCDLPGGNAEEMYFSLSKRLGKLPDQTVLYPGHNYAAVPTSTLGEERKANPYLLCESLQTFLKMRVG